MDLADHEFELLRHTIREVSGIRIPDEKRYLIHQRLEPLARASGCASFSEFYRLLVKGGMPALTEEMIGAITTNETSFFRDAHPFDTFRDHLLPGLARKIREAKFTTNRPAAGPRVRIWSAASSTGQEAYSLAVLVKEYVRANRFQGLQESDFEILATDISQKVLQRAREGVYDELESARGLTPNVKARYFLAEGGRWRLSEEIRSMVTFRQMNLLHPMGLQGPFDVIFCRNVLIYFDEETRKRILTRIHSVLGPDGALVLGASESAFTLTDLFACNRVGSTLLYQRAQGKANPSVHLTRPQKAASLKGVAPLPES